MKIADGLKIIENGWVHKPSGFRVRFQQKTEDGVEIRYSPPREEAPLNSDVTAWRYAWKLWQSTMPAVEAGTPDALYNITVVDDQDKPCRFYETGNFETYNPKNFS